MPSSSMLNHPHGGHASLFIVACKDFSCNPPCGRMPHAAPHACSMMRQPSDRQHIWGVLLRRMDHLGDEQPVLVQDVLHTAQLLDAWPRFGGPSSLPRHLFGRGHAPQIDRLCNAGSRGLRSARCDAFRWTCTADLDGSCRLAVIVLRELRENRYLQGCL